MNEVICVRNVCKYYGGRGNVTRAVNGITFAVAQGEFVGIMGPSGSGKTTLLNCIAAIDAVTSGQILICGKEITAMRARELAAFRRRHLGFIFQDFNLLDTLTGYENIALALSIMGTGQRAMKARIEAAASLLMVDHVLGRFPYQMSGGEQQRIAAARAIVVNPTVVLADEPTGALDSRSARMLLESLQKLNQNVDAAILLVTHDALAASYCDRVLFIKDGRLFNQIVRGDDSRKEFFDRIIGVVSVLEGDLDV